MRIQLAVVSIFVSALPCFGFAQTDFQSACESKGGHFERRIDFDVADKGSGVSVCSLATKSVLFTNEVPSFHADSVTYDSKLLAQLQKACDEGLILSADSSVKDIHVYSSLSQAQLNVKSDLQIVCPVNY